MHDRCGVIRYLESRWLCCGLSCMSYSIALAQPYAYASTLMAVLKINILTFSESSAETLHKKSFLCVQLAYNSEGVVNGLYYVSYSIDE